eukprot:10399110-Lingulodinium_polyedra.AAC.1
MARLVSRHRTIACLPMPWAEGNNMSCTRSCRNSPARRRPRKASNTPAPAAGPPPAINNAAMARAT